VYDLSLEFKWNFYEKYILFYPACFFLSGGHSSIDGP
jgi:hypothetical protein